MENTLVKKKNFKELFNKYKYYYLLMLPGIIFFIIFKYIPMGGIAIAFKDFKVSQGIFGSSWVGLRWFSELFSSQDFFVSFKNTLIISLYKIVFGFPAPIILALLINELRSKFGKRAIQTMVYFPHFLSWVVISGILLAVLSTQGGMLSLFGIKSSPLMDVRYFRGVLVVSQIWKEAGWGTVIYLAAISSISSEMYEAAVIDGATRIQQIFYITLPSMASTIIILLILRTGFILNAGFDQVYMLYNPLVYGVGDILDTYVYRTAFSMGRYSLATAADLFKSVINLIILAITNSVAHAMGQEGIW